MAPRHRPAWLASREALGVFGFADTSRDRRRWVERLDERACAKETQKCGVPEPDPDHDARRSDLRRGWYWGSQEFAERMLTLGAKAIGRPKNRSANAAPEKRAHGEQEARRLISDGLAAAELSRSELAESPGSEPRKVESSDCASRLETDDRGFIVVGQRVAVAQRRQRQPTNPSAAAHSANPAKTTRKMDNSVKNSCLTRMARI